MSESHEKKGWTAEEVLALVEEELEPLDKETEELSERIERLKEQMGVADTVELAEAKAMRYIREHGVPAETAFEWVTEELSEREAAKRAREDELRREKEERLAEKLTDKKIRRHAERNDFSYEDALIELAEPADAQGEVL